MADSILETNSLVPRPHLPQAEEDSLVTVEGFLGSAESAWLFSEPVGNDTKASWPETNFLMASECHQY